MKTLSLTEGMPEAEKARKVRLLTSVLRTMVVMGALGLVAAIVDGRNDTRVTLSFYAPVFLGIFWLSRAVRRGRVEAVAWSVSLFFWMIIAFVTLFFGGLQGENAACFGVCTMLVGSVVGGRAAVALAAASSSWCALIAVLETHHALPAPLGHYSAINSWTAITVALVMISVLLRNSLDSMREMHEQAQESAAQRDEALRRSIQAQKMELVGNLASGVAHDFNNLLSVISSASESLRAELGPGRSGGVELLDDLDAATSRAVLMTRQLLSFGGNQPGDLTRVDLGETVQAFGPMLPRLIGAKIAVDLQIDPGAVVLASRVGIEQVLLNLAVNARDAMPKGGRLSLQVRVDEASVRLLVSDSGVGMDAATRARIFAPFFSTKATGTGLGLATVSETVTRFGGTIRVQSEPGQGSTFEICLARAHGRAAGEAQLAGEATTGAPHAERLLLAEDDPLVRRATVRVLEQAGFDVVAVANGAEALSVLEQGQHFACVVSDIAMPVLDGDALAERLGELYPALPLVLMSGNRAPAAESPGGHHAFLEKPVDRATLLGANDRVCGRG